MKLSYIFLLVTICYFSQLVSSHSWKGKVYYTKYGRQLDRYQAIDLSLTDLELRLADFPLNLSLLQYECYTDDNNYPCTFNLFAKDRSSEYANFASEYKVFLDEIGMADDGRCFVLEFKELEEVTPYMFCVNSDTSETTKKLLKSLRNAYTELVQSLPLEKLPDDVDLNEEF